MTKFMARQGDILLINTSEPPTGCKRVARVGGRIILALGEATGHAHAIVDPDCVLFEHDQLEDRFLTVLAEGGVDLVHEEHATVHLPAGEYIVRRQREYRPGELPQRVAD